MGDDGVTGTTDRVIRVFISSTFLDMRGERDELVKQVFPELRKLCESRGVTWGEVDLRWGITDEQKAEGQVLPVCLAEIRNCRPYFIGILGERYGWDRVDVAPDLMQVEPWLAEHVKEKKSVTELEILHGVLNDPSMAGHAFFYFRDPAYARAHGMIEGPDADDARELGPAGAEARAEARRCKLAALKQRIRDAHRDGKLAHPPHENVADPAALAALVKADLRGVIDGLFPKGSAPDPLAREAAEHEAFGRSRARVYVARPALFAALDAHAAGDGAPLVVLGESGGGKSALLANWVRRLRAAGRSTRIGSSPLLAGVKSFFRRTKASGDVLIIEHYIGATPSSADWAALARRVLEEMSRGFTLKLEIPDQPEALRVAFGKGLYRAAARGRVVLVLDGLNQLEDRDLAPDLGWLPPEVPLNVRLVLSTLPGRSLDALRQRGWPTLTVDLLSADERRALIPLYLKQQYGKALKTIHVERLATAAETANPLYLRTLLEELRQWGDHATIDDRISHYLLARTPKELFAKVLERWEQDFESGRRGLVRDAMVRLWAARRGLSEAELLEMLGPAGRSDESLPRAHWSPLHLAADASLIGRSGLITFAHDYLRQAVEGRYLPSSEARREAHAGVAHYFAKQAPGPRRVDELPWQLQQGESWQDLFECLAQPAFLVSAWQASQLDVRRYWAAVEAHSPLRMVSAYADAIGESSDPECAWYVAQLLGESGHPTEALSIHSRFVAKFRESGNLRGLESSLGNLAASLKQQGRFDEALELLSEQERICRQLGDAHGLAMCIHNRAGIFLVRGKLKEATSLFKDAERRFRRLGNLTGAHRALGGRALILKERGHLDEAWALYGEQERICRQLNVLDDLGSVMINQAEILRIRGELEQAATLYGEAQLIAQQLGDVELRQASLIGQSLIQASRGQSEDAMSLVEETVRTYRKLGDRDGLQLALGNQASLLDRLGKVDEAMIVRREQERINRELGNLRGLMLSLGAQAVALKNRGELDQAMALFEEEERIARQLDAPRELGSSLVSKGLIIQTRGRLDEAMSLQKEAENIFRNLGDLDGLQRSLGAQALLLLDRGHWDEALVLANERERICRKLGHLGGLAGSLAIQGQILLDRGQLDDALSRFEERGRIDREMGDLRGVQGSLGDQAVVLIRKG